MQYASVLEMVRGRTMGMSSKAETSPPERCSEMKDKNHSLLLNLIVAHGQMVVSETVLPSQFADQNDLHLKSNFSPHSFSCDDALSRCGNNNSTIVSTHNTYLHLMSNKTSIS